MIEQYKQILNQAFPREQSSGAEWYVRANREVATMAVQTGYTMEQVAGVVAVLSPQVEWKLNLRTARDFLAHKGRIRSRPGFALNYIKAGRIMRGDIDGIRGPKVFAFWHTLLDPTYPEPVVDTHMIAAYYAGKSYASDLKIISQSVTRLYPIQEAIKTLARDEGWLVSRVQATIWLTFKRLSGPFADQYELWR